jgi:hypothetical protein
MTISFPRARTYARLTSSHSHSSSIFANRTSTSTSASASQTERGLQEDTRDTARRRVRLRDGVLLSGELGLTTDLGNRAVRKTRTRRDRARVASAPAASSSAGPAPASSRREQGQTVRLSSALHDAPARTRTSTLSTVSMASVVLASALQVRERAQHSGRA